MHLVLIDGVPGTGKSVIAQRLALHWSSAGARARWFHEREAEHPVFHFAHLDDLLQHGPDGLEEMLLTGWRALERAPELDVLILDGTLLNLSVGLLVAMQTPLGRIRALFGAVAEMVRPFEPALVHLTYPDVAGQLRSVGARRGSQWAHSMHSMLLRTPFGHAHSDGPHPSLLHAFYARQTAIMATLLDLWPGTSITSVVRDGEWDQRQREIAAAVGAPAFAPARLPTDTLLRYVGRYRGNDSGRDVHVTTDGSTLFLQHADHVADRLVQTARAWSHLVEGLPATITFDAVSSADCPGSGLGFHMRTTFANDRVVTDAFRRVDAS
jgi:hypothetical protein